ncbi:MAG: transposase [Gemmataceae bacterium]|nr:transposase [Gemmataceae bacterium]
MDRFWLLTWATYGTWLPGDARGFVSNVRDGPGPEVRHNLPGTPYDADAPGLRRSARNNLKGEPIWLTRDHADLLVPQFRETAGYRGWALFAAAVMANHVHLVVGVPGDPDPSDLLGDFKAYGSRPLNRRWGKPPPGTWWAEGGSKRKLPDEVAVFGGIRYVRDQEHPLAAWLDADAIRAAFDESLAAALLGERGASAP